MGLYRPRKAQKSASQRLDTTDVSDAPGSSLPAADAAPPVAVDLPTGRAAHRARAWDDTGVRVKVGLLIVAASVWGTAVGLAAASLEAHLSVGLTGAAAVAACGAWFGRKWIADPIEDLVQQLSRITRPERPLSTRALPRHREDEIGQLARAVHQIAVTALRDRHEASNLRRTLDDRIAKATARATSQLSQMAMRDPLTQLGNRRFLEQHLDPLVLSCRAAASDLVCLIIDIDEFKSVNDSLGHAAGDELLKFTAQTIRAVSRQDDYIIRLGGDEFAVFLPGCDVEHATNFAERLQAMFCEHTRLTLPDVGDRVSMSIGVASLLRDRVQNGTELIQTADRRLYNAKQRGKGRAVGL